MTSRVKTLSLLFLCNCMCFRQLKAQTKADKFLDFTASPSLGFRVLGAFDVPKNYKGTKSSFRDSLNKADRPGQSLNFGFQYMFKKNAFEAFSIGLSYTTLTFRRVRENLNIGDEIHPDVGYITGVVQAANLSVKYDYKYHYAEVPLLWYKNAEKKGKYKDLDLWYVVGFAPAILVKNKIGIFTEGFSLNGSNKFIVNDKESKGVTFNLFLQAAYRAEYYMYKNLHGLVQPHLRVPVLPSSQGAQTVWIPQLSLDLGLIFLLGV